MVTCVGTRKQSENSFPLCFVRPASEATAQRRQRYSAKLVQRPFALLAQRFAASLALIPLFIRTEHEKLLGLDSSKKIAEI